MPHFSGFDGLRKYERGLAFDPDAEFPLRWFLSPRFPAGLYLKRIDLMYGGHV